MIDRDFIEKIEELSAGTTPAVVHVDGRAVLVTAHGDDHVVTTVDQLKTIAYEEDKKRSSTPNVFQVETLDAFARLVPAMLEAEGFSTAARVAATPESGPIDPVAIHVESPTRVVASLLDPDVFNHRRVLAVCDCAKMTPPLDFTGKWMTQEAMNILLQTSFDDDVMTDSDRAALMQVVGTLVDQQIVEIKDDGVSQEVITTRNLQAQREIAPRLVSLRPYRTFRSLPQPASPFLLRIRGGKDKPTAPELALFEADGGRWRLTAMQAVAAYLQPVCVEHRFALLV